MKRLKIAVIALFALVTVANVHAQDSDNQWAFSFGLNSVDIRGNKSLKNIGKDYLGTGDWNTLLPSINRIAVAKYLEKGFSLELAGSFNKIDKKDVHSDGSGDMFYAFDANVRYDLNSLIGKVFGSSPSWLDSYIYSGFGAASLGRKESIKFNGGFGANVWFNENLGLNLQSGGSRHLTGQVPDYFQHSVSLVFKFGGKDTDGDGVYDKDDSCPDVAGLVAFNGCPDTDGDGVQDSKDACPNVAGLAALNGCPDADGDGIADKDDMCPNEKGSSANRGCPDSDGDGVVNKDDKCPNVAGPTDNGGCPWPDTDGDGVLDKNDNCVNEAGPASNNGCPEPVITEAAMKTINMEAKSILFNTNRTSFKKGVASDLDAIVAVMNEFPKATFAIGGHTDSVGKADMNAKLSQKRADAVVKYFVSKGIDASRLSSKGYGEDSPIDDNNTRAGRANNRRVEVKVSNL